MSVDTYSSGAGYGRVAEPCTVILFGASGDLAKRKVIPALYDLAVHGAQGPRYSAVGFARTAMTEEVFRATAEDAAKSISEAGPDRLPKIRGFGLSLRSLSGGTWHRQKS